MAGILGEVLGFHEVLQLVHRNSDVHLRVEGVTPRAQLRAPFVHFLEEVREGPMLELASSFSSPVHQNRHIVKKSNFKQLVLGCIIKKLSNERLILPRSSAQLFWSHFQNCAMVLIRLRNAGGCSISNPASITSHIGARATFACSSMIFLTRFQLFALFSSNISICTSIFSQKIPKQKVYKCRLPFLG